MEKKETENDGIKSFIPLRTDKRKVSLPVKIVYQHTV